MSKADDRGDRPPRLMPSAHLAELLPASPELPGLEEGWRDISLQVFRNLPSSIDLPGLQDDTLITHLAGPVLVEAVGCSGRLERRWIG